MRILVTCLFSGLAVLAGCKNEGDGNKANETPVEVEGILAESGERHEETFATLPPASQTEAADCDSVAAHILILTKKEIEVPDEAAALKAMRKACLTMGITARDQECLLAATTLAEGDKCGAEAKPSPTAGAQMPRTFEQIELGQSPAEVWKRLKTMRTNTDAKWEKAISPTMWTLDLTKLETKSFDDSPFEKKQMARYTLDAISDVSDLIKTVRAVFHKNRLVTLEIESSNLSGEELIAKGTDKYGRLPDLTTTLTFLSEGLGYQTIRTPRRASIWQDGRTIALVYESLETRDDGSSYRSSSSFVLFDAVFLENATNAKVERELSVEEGRKRRAAEEQTKKDSMSF